jgi:NADPH-dependent curcumin reductase CurA
MNEGKSYAPPVQIGEIMTGETVGVVVESNSKKFNVGDKLCVHMGWQSYTKCKDSEISLIRIPETNLPLSLFLGTLGMPGRTAYYGFNRVGKPRENDTVVVSAASGAVGSVVGQLAKMQGCKVIGVAGGPEKTSYVKNTLGFDECIYYKNEDISRLLKEYWSTGIDIYFENVGGELSRHVSQNLNKGARVPICGFISKYNSTDIMSEETPFHVFGNLNPKPEHRFFVVREWMNEFEKTTHILMKHVEDGSIKYRETIVNGLENAPSALNDVLSGKNFGKQLIKIN